MRIRLARKIVKRRYQYSQGKYLKAMQRLGYVFHQWKLEIPAIGMVNVEYERR